MKRFLSIINLLFLITTLILYLVDLGAGLYSQLFLGIFQLLHALLLIPYIIIKKNKNHKLHLINYWFSAITILSIIILAQAYYNFNDFLKILTVHVIPMCIATYFVYITYLIQKK